MSNSIVSVLCFGLYSVYLGLSKSLFVICLIRWFVFSFSIIVDRNDRLDIGQ